jgi:hypothetical protein
MHRNEYKTRCTGEKQNTTQCPEGKSTMPWRKTTQHNALEEKKNNALAKKKQCPREEKTNALEKTKQHNAPGKHKLQGTKHT